MKRTIIGGTLAAALAIAIGSAASAQNYGSKAANLQAMRWHAQQQMARGLPNPYPGVNLFTGQGFSEFRRGLTNPYFSNFNNFGYGNYGNYGYNPWNNNSFYTNPLYGYGNGYWY